MLKKISLIGFLLTLCFSIQVKASSDPFESAGLRHLFSSYGGIFLLDFDKSHHVVNVTPAEEKAGNQLVVDDFRNGFRLLQNVNSGLGLEAPIFAIPQAAFSIGIDLMTGVNASFDRYAANWDAISNMSFPTLPTRAEDMKKWTTGDNVLFLARGGVGFAAGFGYKKVAGAAVYYFAEGNWAIYVEKTENNHAYVKVTNTLCNSVGTLVSTVIAGINVPAFRETDRWFSFNYDLNNPEAVFAYEEALRGNLIPSDDIVESKSGGVERVMSSKGVSIGWMPSWYFGVPFLAMVGGKSGSLHYYGNSFPGTDGSQTEVHSGIYINHRYSAGLLSKHGRHLNDFFSTHWVYSSPAGEASMGYDGRYLWAFESERVSYRKLYREMNRLASKTGIDSLREIGLPTYKHLGYLNIKFNVEIPQETVNVLMAWARSAPEVLEEVLTTTGTDNVNSYFEGGTDPSELCSEDASRELATCKAQLLQETGFASSQMVAELRIMDETKESYPKTFAKAFAKFGNRMATNPFTFREVLEMTVATPMNMTLSIEGERVSRFKKSIKPSPSGYVLQ